MWERGPFSLYLLLPLINLLIKGFPGGSVVKDLPANTGAIGDTGSTPGSGRSPGVGNGNPLQYSCWNNSMDRGAWRATVYGVAESQIGLKPWSKHAQLIIINYFRINTYSVLLSAF